VKKHEIVGISNQNGFLRAFAGVSLRCLFPDRGSSQEWDHGNVALLVFFQRRQHCIVAPIREKEICTFLVNSALTGQVYLQTLRLDPARISALSALADTYFALELYTDALEAYGKVLDLDPNNAEAWFNQATVFELLGRADQAVHGYERSEQLRAESTRRLKYPLDGK
jgi:hypothetical protein